MTFTDSSTSRATSWTANSLDLLERNAELAELDAALEHAVGGEGRVVLVSGEAGIGKSSLVERFTRVHRARVPILWGGCDALFTPSPLGPLLEMAVQAGSALAGALAAADRHGVFGAMLSELQRAPTVVVIDDVHWADEATIDVLRYVGRRIARTSGLLVLTYRDDDIGTQHPLRTLLGDLASSTSVVRVPLAALSPSAVADLIGDRAFNPEALHAQTGGNPFFVTEILASSGSGVPLSVRDAVLGRIGRLSSAAIALLEAAAVGGPRIEPALLQTMQPDAFAALDECLTRGLLRERDTMLEFRHELARQAVMESIPVLRRAHLHRLALKALEGVPADRANLARLAHHAQGTGDLQAMLAHLPAAARQAAAVGAHRAAAGLLASGLRAADGLPGVRRAALYERHAMESYHIADMPAAISSWRQAIGLWRDAGDRRKQGMSLAVLAAALASAGQRQEARRANQAAIDLLTTLPPGRELALAYGTQAILHQYNHELGDATTLAERAITLAEQAGDTRIAVMAYDTLGMSSMFLDYERGRGFLEHARDRALQAGLDSEAARAYGDLGAVSVALFQLDRAERYLSEALAFMADRDLDRTRVYTLAWQALAQLHRGRWAEAERTADEVLGRPASSSAHLTALLVRARLDARRGDREVAWPRLEQALDLAGAPEEIRLIGPVRAARAEVAALFGDTPRSLSECDSAYDLALQRRHQWIAGELAYWRWRAGAVDRPPDWIAAPFALEIAGDWSAAADAWHQLGCPYEEARALTDGDAAARLRALALFDRLGAAGAAGALRQRMRTEGVQRVPRGPRPTTRANQFGLTSRQLEILELLSSGCSNSEIARQMSIAPKTAEHHVAAVLAKLDVASRQAAVALAREQQLIG